MKFILLATHQVGRGRLQELLRLLKSVEQQDAKGQTIQLHLLLQGTKKTPEELSEFTDVHFHLIPEFVGLSKARNLLLEKTEIAEDDLLLFPDDDCWYPKQFFANLALTSAVRNADMIGWGFSELTEDWPLTHDFKRMFPIDTMRRTVSIAFGLSGGLVTAVGLFDEKLGLGTKVGGAEDTDFSYRALQISNNPIITRAKLIGHREMSGSLQTRADNMGRYWESSMLILLKYFEMRLTPLLFYRLAAGIYLILTGRITVARFLWPFQNTTWKAA